MLFLRKQASGCFAPGPVLLGDNSGPGNMVPSLDSHFRGNDTLGVPPRGEAGCSIRLNCYLKL